jgi:hypothetical protein
MRIFEKKCDTLLNETQINIKTQNSLLSDLIPYTFLASPLIFVRHIKKVLIKIEGKNPAISI